MIGELFYLFYPEFIDSFTFHTGVQQCLNIYKISLFCQQPQAQSSPSSSHSLALGAVYLNADIPFTLGKCRPQWSHPGSPNLLPPRIKSWTHLGLWFEPLLQNF